MPELKPYDYYYPSGSQVKVLFGNIWVDDIVTLGYSLAEQKAPLYGYASTYFDGVSQGTKIVEGSFSIAFKRAEYIPSMLKRLQSNPFLSGDVLRELKNKRADAVAIERSAAMNDFVIPGAKRNVGYLEALDMARSDDLGRFQDLSDNLKRILWTDVPTGNYSATDHDKVSGRVVSGFDIVINYGAASKWADDVTIKVIQDCHITGVSQQLAPSGEPIMEVYSFFGRAMDPGMVEQANVDTEEALPTEEPVAMAAEAQAEDADALIALIPRQPDDVDSALGSPGGYVILTIPDDLFEKGWRFSYTAVTVVDDTGLATDFYAAIEGSNGMDKMGGTYNYKERSVLYRIMMETPETTSAGWLRYRLSLNGVDGPMKQYGAFNVPVRNYAQTP